MSTLHAVHRRLTMANSIEDMVLAAVSDQGWNTASGQITDCMSPARRTALPPVDDSQDVFGERDQVSAPHRAYNAEKEAHDRLPFTA